MKNEAAAQPPSDDSDDIDAEFESLKAMSITINETARRIAKEELEESKRALKPATKRQRASNPIDASSSDEQSSSTKRYRPRQVEAPRPSPMGSSIAPVFGAAQAPIGRMPWLGPHVS